MKKHISITIVLTITVLLIDNNYCNHPKFIKERILNAGQKMDAEAESNYLKHLYF